MTKVQFFEQISEIDILNYYVEDFDPTKTANYKSPFSTTDNKPSLSVYHTAKGWQFKSHNTGHQGDVFQFVADLKGIDCKSNFNEILEIIKSDLGVTNGHKYQSSQTTIKVKPLEPQPIAENKKENIKIEINEDKTLLLSYFAPLGISAEILERYNVQAMKYHEFHNKEGKRCKFDYIKLNQLAVLYSFNDRIKVYFPAIEGIQEKKFGFKSQTTEDIFGLEQITQPCDKLYIAAGEKDCLTLISRGYQAISFQSENTNPTQKQIDQISNLAKEIFIVYDTDTSGENASKKLAKSTGWKEITLNKTFKDITDFFTKNKSAVSEFENHINPATEVKKTVFHITEDFIQKRYNVRFNTISLEIEIKPKHASIYQPLNENDLYIELNKANIAIGIDKLVAILKSNFVPKYNPIQHYFENLPKWNNMDNIGHLSAHLEAKENQEHLNKQFKNWIVRALRCAIEPNYFNKQAFIIVHNSQNSGKTSFCRFLTPPELENYAKDNLSEDKDGKIALAKNFLINLDELDSLSKYEINSLKSLFTLSSINERLPYDRKNSIIPRITSFVGSTNLSEFLTDETGSVRWLCFEIKQILWSYKNSVDINQVWAHAYHLYKTGYHAEMSREDISENELRNAKFQMKSVESELIPNFLIPADSHHDDAEFLTATDILQFISTRTVLRINKIAIGKAMPQNGFIRVKESKSDKYGYWCIKKI